MADITVTAGNVLKAAGGTVLGVTAGGTVTAGQLVYADTAATNIKVDISVSGIAKP